MPFTEVLAQSITNAAELNSVLLSASGGILFLDEIHLLSAVNQHSLLQVLDKRRIFLNGGKSVTSIPVAPFTLVGATTDPDGIIDPLIDRFRMVLHLDYYSHEELAAIVKQRLRALHWDYGPHLVEEIVKRARGTPRIALRLLQSAHRVQVARGGDVLTVECLQRACEVERISGLGADNIQQKLMSLARKRPAASGGAGVHVGSLDEGAPENGRAVFASAGPDRQNRYGTADVDRKWAASPGDFPSGFCPQSVRMTSRTGCEILLKVTGKRPFYVGEVSDECPRTVRKGCGFRLGNGRNVLAFTKSLVRVHGSRGISKTDPDPADETPGL